MAARVVDDAQDPATIPGDHTSRNETPAARVTFTGVPEGESRPEMAAARRAIRRRSHARAGGPPQRGRGAG